MTIHHLNLFIRVRLIKTACFCDVIFSLKSYALLVQRIDDVSHVTWLNLDVVV